MKVFTDFQGLAIRLTDERLAHILDHPEMADMEDAIAETIANPARAWCNPRAIRRRSCTIAFTKALLSVANICAWTSRSAMVMLL